MNPRAEIVRFSQLMYERGYSAASEGNLSVRLSSDRVLITPSNKIKAFLKPNELVEIDFQGALRKGGGKPTTERFTHLQIYRDNPEIKAIVHAHPFYSVLATVVGSNPFERPVLAEAGMFLRAVKLVQYSRPSTEEGALAVKGLSALSNCLLLDRHGTFTYGPDLKTAFSLLEIMEKVARMDYEAGLTGKEKRYLPDDEVKALGLIPY